MGKKFIFDEAHVTPLRQLKFYVGAIPANNGAN